MPRLTNPDYLRTHHWLAAIWTEHQLQFAELTPQDQRLLHDYFAPSWTWISDQYLPRYRGKISKDEPGLPAAAGRAVAKLRKQLETIPARTFTPQNTSRSPVIVKSVIRPTVDEDRMAAALSRALQDLEAHDSPDRAA